MAERLSRQPLQVHTDSRVELNDALRRIQIELDKLAGLQGPIILYDSLSIKDDDGNTIHSWGA